MFAKNYALAIALRNSLMIFAHENLSALSTCKHFCHAQAISTWL